MSTKVKVYLLVLGCFFLTRWWTLNYQFIPEIAQRGIDILNEMSSACSGYNDVRLHGSVYSLFFVLLVNMLLPRMNNQFLYRMKREVYVRKLYGKMILGAIIFTCLLLGVAVLCMTVTVGASTLWEWGYYQTMFLTFIATFIYYVLMGTVFLFIYLVMGSKRNALFGSYLISVLLLGLQTFTRIPWIPADSLIVMDDVMRGNFLMAKFLLNLVKLLGLSLFFYLFTMSVFKRKDVLGKNE